LPVEIRVNPIVGALAAVAAAAAVTDWWAVATGRRAVIHVAKPATLAALIGVALALEPFDAAVRTWMVAGLALSLVGDVLLMLPERWFAGGLAAFLGAHVTYIIGLQLAHTSWTGAAVGLAVVLVGGATLGRRIVAEVAAGSQQAVTRPVVAYLVVISAMVVSAFGTAAATAIGGALLFYASDATLASNRFVEPRRWGPLAVIVTYHLGQAGLVAWLAH
jgi:uncharacterized membrane protein YhhN